MYDHQPNVDHVSDHTVLWRYMNMCKFCDLITSKTFFLPRADQFIGDALEGHLPGGSIKSIYGELPEPIAETFIQVNNSIISDYMFVSCWRMDNSSKQELWEKYHCKEDGIAIKTTAGKLKDSIEDTRRFCIGKVVYDSHSSRKNEDGNVFRTIYLKDDCFMWESEARLVHWAGPPTGLLSSANLWHPEKFIRLKMDPISLVDALEVSPHASASFVAEVVALAANARIPTH
jgi:hypothetical protein